MPELKNAQLGELIADTGRLAELIGMPYEHWAHQCHAVSIRLLKTGLFGYGRIARGGAEGVLGQHSWIVLSHDVYDPKATIIDPTLWSYDESVTGIWTGKNLVRHFPQGYGNIWQWGRPETAEESGEPVIELNLTRPLSRLADHFLNEAIGPMGRRGWMQLANAPMQGWPSAEIIAAIDDTPKLRVYIPIDILGMLTDRNPKGLYLRDEDEEKP